jgi:hypothetical protein
MPKHRSRAARDSAFLCECGATLCDRTVWMSGLEYAAGTGPVVADGHEPGGGSLGKCALCGRPGRDKRWNGR